MPKVILWTFVAGCESMTPTIGNLPPSDPPTAAQLLDAATTKPVSATPPAAPPAEAAPAPSAPTPPPVAPPPNTPGAVDEAALLAAALGEAPPPSDAPLPGPPTATVPRRDPWRPGQAVEGFGVRLLSVTPQSTPPRAILSLPSGEEIVIQPGTMIPEHHLVVMAVGEDAVQVARIVADGDRVRVETQDLSALYRGTALRSP
jgi:hypothetical protein